LGDNLKLKLLVERICLVSKRLFAVPTFFNYAIADGLYNLLRNDPRRSRRNLRKKNPTRSYDSSSRMISTEKLRKFQNKVSERS